MSGNELKNILTSQGYNISEIAMLLGYGSPQRLHSALAAADVKSGLIEDIARVLKKHVWEFYQDTPIEPIEAVALESSIAVAGNSNHVSNISEKFIALLSKKDEQIDRLLQIIEQLNKKGA